MDKHISSVVKLASFKSVNFAIFEVSYLNLLLLHLQTPSHIDYCNSLLYGLPKYYLYCLQKVQNSVAHIVTPHFLFVTVTPILKALPWLPVKYHINFKLCCITHCALSLGDLII